MKSLFFPAIALMLLAACQPSGTGNTAAITETLTQPQKDAPAGSRPLLLSTSKGSLTNRASKSKVSKPTKFSLFLNGFPQASFPLALNGKTSRNMRNREYISYNYDRFIPEMEGERFSREVGKEFYYLAKVSETPRYTTVVYAIKNVMMGDNAPYGYVLASYNSKGRLIDKMVVGGQVEMEDLLRTGNIQPDLTIEIKEYQQKWEKDPEEEGYYDNKIVGTTLKSVYRYRITEGGHFEKINALLSMR